MEKRQFESVLQFDSLHQFLASFYSFKKKLNPRFSYESWARSVGGLDRSHLRQISTGKRSIPDSKVPFLVKYFNFRNEEKQHFLDLVALCSSNTTKRALNTKVRNRVRYQKELHIIKEVEKFLSTPEIPVLATLISFDDVPVDNVFLANSLGVKTDRVTEWLLILEALGFIKKDRNGRWKNTRQSFRVPSELGSDILSRFQRLSLEKAIEGLNASKDQRYYETLMIPLNPQDYQDYLSLLGEFRDQVLSKFNVQNLEDRLLFQVNLSISPATLKPTLGQKCTRK